MPPPPELAHSLFDMGISALKIWPFDRLAEIDRGTSIARADLARGVAPLSPCAAPPSKE